MTPDFYPSGSAVMAPVAGHTDIPFRRMIRRFGCRYAFTEMIDAGSLVPDEVVEGMIESAFDTIKGVDGFLLDGFPRNLAQAQDLDKILEKRGESVTAVVGLMIDDDMIFQRIRGRAIIEGRADDASDETIANRIKTYHSQTEPLIDYYKKADKYHEVVVNGGTIEENRARVLALMETIA